jgi:hypothetical protein
MKTEVTITHSMDNNNEPIVSVPMTNVDKSALLRQDDFNRLYEAGLDPRWRFGQGQVYERGKSKVSISRLIADANPGDKVQYRDNDGLNLKRDNLVIANGSSKSLSGEIMQDCIVFSA